jgi:hypothetical protein
MRHETANKSTACRTKALHKPALLAFIAFFSLHCHSNIRFRLLPARGFICSTPPQGTGPFVMHPKNQNIDVHWNSDKETSNESAEDSSYGESELIHSFFMNK